MSPLTAIWLGGALLSWLPACVLLLRSFDDMRMSMIERSVMALLALGVALLWPVTVVMLIVGAVSGTLERRLP